MARAAEPMSPPAGPALDGAHRVVALACAGFLALTAIPGGLALLLGLAAPPTSLLAGTPFDSFVVPGLVLMLVVGGSGAVTTYLVARRHGLSPFATLGTGVVIMSFEFVEILTIGRPTGPGLVMQIFYFALGVVLVLSAAGAFRTRASG